MIKHNKQKLIRERLHGLQPALLCRANMKVRIQRNTLYEMSPKWEDESVPDGRMREM